jgi:hypothetical protein
MTDFGVQIEKFLTLVGKAEIEIYNEFSFQHELGIYLRSINDSKFQVQFERPINYFDISGEDFEKKEIDIVAFSKDKSEKCAFELKYPRHGQYPERMFKSCQDISFLEHLCRLGFSAGYFIMIVDDDLFFREDSEAAGIYRHFRGGIPIHGLVTKPTGKDKGKMKVTIAGSYPITWKTIDSKRKYVMVEINC